MACSLKQTCTIDDVVAVQRFLFPEKEAELVEDGDEIVWQEDNWKSDWGDDENENKADDVPVSGVTDFVDDWLQKCRLAFSPTYDLLAIAHGDKLVLLSARSDSTSRTRSDGPRRYKVSNQLKLSDEPGEYITSVLCIPLVSLKKTSHGSVDWSCVVVGFSSGYVRMYTETGDQLISQLLHESAVVEIRCRTHDPMVLKRSVYVSDQPDEVTILYGDTIILIEGFSLFQTLRACRSQVALAAASGGFTIEPPPLSYKKWRLTGKQNAISSHVSPGDLTPNPFDQMRTASVLGGFSAEIRGTAPAMSCFVATGSSPFAGFYYAIEGSAQPHLSHVAFAVASKLKSALYSSASRWLAWGTGAQQEPGSQQKPKPKVELGSPLDIRYGMPDPLRHGYDIILAPGSLLATSALAATTDSFGRVILFDVTRAIALRMWKGYRDAQIGFILIFDDAHRIHKHHGRGEPQKKLRRHALFLVIYAPRRGLLEVWTCISGPRVAAFNVSKNARLLCPGYGMMGLNTSTMTGTTARAFQCCLLEANGQVREIRIPFHLALSDANSKKARDIHLLKKLNIILHSRRRAGGEAVKILLEMRISAMLRPALEKLLHARNIGAETCRDCITAIQQRLKEGGALKKQDSDLLKYCDTQIHLIDLYDAICKLNDAGYSETGSTTNDIEDAANVGTMSDLLHMTRTEATEALSVVARFHKSRLVPRVQFDTHEKPSLDVSEFLDCFSVGDPLSKHLDGEANWEPELQVSKGNKLIKLAAFLFHSSLFGSSATDDILFTLNGALDLKPRTVLDLLFKFWLAQDDLITNNLSHNLKRLYCYIEACSKKSSSVTSIRSDLESDVDSPQPSEATVLWEWIRDDICATSHNTIATYFLAVVTRAVAITSNTRDNKEKEDSEDGDDWEKMRSQYTGDEEVPPSYQESCTGEASKSRSGDWETLWIDVEKWNLFIHQLEDSILINTSINLGKIKRRMTTQEGKDSTLDAAVEHDDDNDPNASVSIKDLLSNGPGFMAELVSHSICELNIPPHCIERGSVTDVKQNLKEAQKNFLDFLHSVLYSKFPYSLAPDCLHSHCFWELVVEWNKKPLEIAHFTTATEHLKLVHSDAHARHGLALMAWKTFIAKRYAALSKLIDKVGKAPKDRLCRKEVGISDTLMPSFCQSCTDILQIIADADLDEKPPVPATSSNTISGGAEDPWQNVTGKRSIMDIGRAHAQANYALVQHNMHLNFVLHATMQFLLRGVKPLSALFDRRGKACFSLELTTCDPTLPSPDTIEQEVSNARQRFLTKVVSAAVQQLASHMSMKQEDTDAQRSELNKQQQKQELEKWIETAVYMAAEFQISKEKIKMHHVDELFKNGLDAIGLEVCTMVADKEVLSSSLILIVGQRLSYILLHANPDDGVIMMSRMSPKLSTWIRSRDSSVLKRPDVPIMDTLTLARTVLTMMSENHSLYSIALSLEEAASSIASS